MASRSSTWEGRELEFLELPVASPSDIDEFLEDGHRSPESLAASEGRRTEVWDEEDEENEDSSRTEESKNFWETQKQLLQAILCRSSPTESRIRSAKRAALKEIEMGPELSCDCGKQTTTPGSRCWSCLMEKLSGRLQKAGFNIAICKSKWRSSPYIPSGEHTFLDVLETKLKKGEVRVLIELNFRAEFEMARASEEYNGLVQQLPEVFVGKVERLQSVIRIVCSAAKKCMKERRMHMGPWRKERYMQAKWLGPCERRAPLPALPVGLNNRPRRPRASMLTVDLTEKLAGMHRTPVEVV
ncbi:uncharacterized protein LOC116209302 [Punica granatum]|uniref:Uncharacterized protein n=2 Tax=Punica granatum TaxID=22663 RepID=A0A218WYK7_PUNGR|nr:uncharacterized protein LOC116209302 [Punica granatum]OWM77450.1 hypothetical protein CDL15_Pgr016847 [Punica granatum]PKI51228.1 hypothetical protein CRG98_028376 [Punica granatum]